MDTREYEKETAMPEVTMQGLTFLPIPEFADADVIFGVTSKKWYFSREKLRDLPKIPKKFEDEVSRMFFSGGAYPEFGEDVDKKLAKRFIRALLGSWEPPHECKEATIAYALWVWSPEAAKERMEGKKNVEMESI